MAKTIYEKLKAILKQIQNQGGETLMVCRDGESDYSMLSCLLQSQESSVEMFIEMFTKFPFLIPDAMCAMSHLTRGVFGKDESDDDDDDDDGDDDFIPIDGCDVGCAVCLN